jgi:hypothetical protein
LATIKGRYFEKIEWGINSGVVRTNYKFKSLFISLKNLLSADMDNTLNGGKVPKNFHISINNGQT